jgi:hypothetical protein
VSQKQGSSRQLRQYDAVVPLAENDGFDYGHGRARPERSRHRRREKKSLNRLSLELLRRLIKGGSGESVAALGQGRKAPGRCMGAAKTPIAPPWPLASSWHSMPWWRTIALAAVSALLAAVITGSIAFLMDGFF